MPFGVGPCPTDLSPESSGGRHRLQGEHADVSSKGMDIRIGSIHPITHEANELAKGDYPELNIQQLLEAIDLYLDQDWIDHITQGFWLAESEEQFTDEQFDDWPREQRAAYFARRGYFNDIGITLDENTQELMEEINAMWKSGRR